jgi:hypothetical protein
LIGVRKAEAGSVETWNYPWGASMITGKFVKEYVSAWNIAWIAVIAIDLNGANVSDVIYENRITNHKKDF